MDSDNPKRALIALLLAARPSAVEPTLPLGTGASGVERASLRAELQALRGGELRRRAAAAGVSQQELDDADDADVPKVALMELLLREESVKNARKDEQARAVAVLYAELQALRVGELRRRAAAAGVSQQELDDADDADVPKVALMELLLREGSAMKNATGGEQPPARPVADGRAAPRATIGIVNTKDVDGTPRYKVRYEGLAKEDDDWVGADQVTEKQIEKFQAMKAKAAAKAGDTNFEYGAAGIDSGDVQRRDNASVLAGMRTQNSGGGWRSVGPTGPRDPDTASKGMYRTPALRAELAAELAVLKLSQLYKSAVDTGADKEAIERAGDSDDPKAAFIELLLQ
jgi:hypothetical protein